MKETDLCYWDIETLGQSFRKGETTPLDAVEAVFDRIRQYNPGLNAFITLLEEPARLSAITAAEEIKNGLDRGPLHGIPFSLKDLFETEGIQTSAASQIWRGHISDHTATTARRLIDAGAILIGKCNLLEFAYGIVHPDYGQCNNPWNLQRTSGGSSSGSAASVAAGMGWASLGTDTGGSIRIPASYCGIVGVKPTYGRVSRNGVFPLSWSLDHVGTLTRTVKDAAIILRTIAGEDRLDPTASNAPVPDYAVYLDQDVRGLRLGVLEQHMTGSDLHPGAAQAVETAIRVLEQRGMTVHKITIPSMGEADEALLLAILSEGTIVHQNWLRETPSQYAEMTRQQLELGALIPAVSYIRAQQYRTRLLKDFLNAFDQVDVLINPTVAWEAPAEDPVIAGSQGADEAHRTGPFNLTGLPAISLPCGFGPQGLPLGMQIIARPMGESLMFHVAHAYEQHARWFEHHPHFLTS